ncbi:MAG: DUF3108 domain-containing protein [Proteobacteria bacterium]|nr:DUF3108 domain-containing protein [Pseudomonadota bacterium]
MGIRSAIFAILLLGAASVRAHETTLGYDAFVAGAKVGGAEVKIDKDDARYAISGTAWSIGVLNFVTRWQSMFTATGRFADQSPVNDGYRFIERTRDKVKELFLQNGKLTYVKNGHVRSPQTPTSLDLLSALFVSRDCGSTGAEVHNGKDPFTLKLTGRESLPESRDGATERCSFELSNEDNERIDATVWLGQIDGLTVPIRLDVTGALEGTLKLHSTSLAAFTSTSRSTAIKI